MLIRFVHALFVKIYFRTLLSLSVKGIHLMVLPCIARKSKSSGLLLSTSSSQQTYVSIQLAQLKRFQMCSPGWDNREKYGWRCLSKSFSKSAQVSCYEPFGTTRVACPALWVWAIPANVTLMAIFSALRA